MTSTSCPRGHANVVRNAKRDCVECNRERARDWRVANLERSRASGSRWAKENPDKALDARLRRQYGLTLAQYESMNAAQGGVCHICGEPEMSRGRLHVDHCHQTGVVRALLCNRCNVAIGMLDDSVSKARALLAYLERADERKVNGDVY